MNDKVETVDINMPLDEIAERLLALRLRRVPVIEDGKLVGIISRPDLIYVGHTTGSFATGRRRATPTRGRARR